MLTRRATAIAVAVIVATLTALLVFRAATAPTEEEQVAAAVRAFTDSGNRMTPDEVGDSFGKPDQVFRNNPRALCWAYTSPYSIRMCWGPKRKAAWISHNIPIHEFVTPTDR